MKTIYLQAFMFKIFIRYFLNASMIWKNIFTILVFENKRKLIKSYMMLKLVHKVLNQYYYLHNILLVTYTRQPLVDSDLTLKKKVKKESSLLRGIKLGLKETGTPQIILRPRFLSS